MSFEILSEPYLPLWLKKKNPESLANFWNLNQNSAIHVFLERKFGPSINMAPSTKAAWKQILDFRKHNPYVSLFFS